jgi:tetratricopeptide (TPR) repeat protein
MNKILFVLLFLPGSFTGYSQNTKSDSLLTLLKLELTRENRYDQDKEKRITRLRSALLHTDSANFNAQFDLYSTIFSAYRSYKFDSAFVYVRKMIDLCEQFQEKDNGIRSKILLGSILLNSGFYKEAFDVTEKINLTGLSNDIKTDYHFLRARLNASIGDYDNDAYFSQHYYKQSAEDYKNAEIVTPPNDFEKTINLAFLPDSLQHKKLTPDFFYNTIIRQQLSAHGIAMVATRISFAYTGEDRILFLALAAINDIRSSTKEILAIFLLGQELFKMDRTNDAYIFMKEAARLAHFYGGRNRAVQIESMLPLIAAKLIDEKQHQKDKLLIGFLTFLIVAVILFFLLVIYRRQMLRIKASEQMIRVKNNELESVNEKLWESSKIKEELIGLFFKTYSSYIEMLDTIKRETLHYIKLGKYNEVHQLLKNIHIDREKGNLYHMLDRVFLQLFPNFMASFNTLLKEEDQIWPKSGETLTATVRIFALMRLGIQEHEAIAKILDYSVSTIYTYKTRIKSRALVPANDFDRKIMEIKFIDKPTT